MKRFLALVSAIGLAACITGCSSLKLFEEPGPADYPTVYTWTDSSRLNTSMSLYYSSMPTASLRECFTPESAVFKDLPEDFTLPVLYPEARAAEFDVSVLDHTGIIIIYYYTDSKGTIRGCKMVHDEFGYVSGDIKRSFAEKIQSSIYEKHSGDISYIFGVVLKEKFVEKEDLGLFPTAQEGRNFPEGYQSSRVHVINVINEPELLTGYVSFTEFEGNDAEMIFKYGEIDYITVHSPVGDFVRNRPMLPEPGLGTSTSSRLAYSENSYTEDQFAFEFEEKGMMVWDDFSNQVVSINSCSDLNIGRDYILDVKLVEECSDYFLSENGWKIYGCSNAMNTLLRKRLHSYIFGTLDSICFEVCLLKTDDEYELVLKAKPFEYKSTYGLF